MSAPVELIYRNDCPRLELAREQLRRAFAEADLPATWREWRVDDPDSPPHVRQLPSPTFVVAGVDACSSTTAVSRDSACRVYRCGGGRARAVPAVAQLAGALRSRIAGEHTTVRSEPPRARATCESSDEALMVAYQLGDVAAFELLYERYQRRLRGYFWRRFADRELAADLSQRTMLRIHRARHGYDPSRPFESWLFTVSANLVKDELKWRSRRPGDACWSEPNARLATTSTDPEHEMMVSEARGELRTALRELPAAQRDVVILHKLEGRSFPEIAASLGEHVEAVKARAFRGYRRVRRGIEANRITPPCCAAACSSTGEETP